MGPKILRCTVLGSEVAQAREYSLEVYLRVPIKAPWYLRCRRVLCLGLGLVYFLRRSIVGILNELTAPPIVLMRASSTPVLP
jgi:hypothetical protein